MQNRRIGMTMIEIVVVIAIIGILIAFLLPAIQSSREASRKAVCQNNLRQVATAVLSHESANRALPALYNGTFLPQPRNAIDEFHFHSWRSAILPYLEQSNLLASLNLALPATTPANQTALNVQLASYLCPSTSNEHEKIPDVGEWNNGQFPVKIAGTAARSDYEVIGGVQVMPQIRSSADLSIIRFGAWGEPTYDVSNGASIRYRTARLADITDGVSNTLLIAERAGRPDLYQRGEKPDPYPYRDPSRATDHQQGAWAISTHFRWTVYHKAQTVNMSNSTGIYSFHPGGAFAGLADGSVRFLKETTSTEILKALGTRAEGEMVSIE